MNNLPQYFQFFFQSSSNSKECACKKQVFTSDASKLVCEICFFNADLESNLKKTVT